MRDKLTERFDRMMKVLFRQEGANLEIGILASEEAQDFIEAHSSVLNGSFRKVEMSETMRKRLERSNYVFSGLSVKVVKGHVAFSTFCSSLCSKNQPPFV